MNRYEYYHLMDQTSTWGGTFTQPNLFWYDFGATTSSSEVAYTNWIGPSGTYSFFRKAYDFSGNGYHLRNSISPTYQLTLGYSSTNGKTIATIGSYTYSTSSPTSSVSIGTLETYDKLINQISVSQSTTIYVIKSAYGTITDAGQTLLLKWSSTTASNYYGYYNTISNNTSSFNGKVNIPTTTGGSTSSSLVSSPSLAATSSVNKYQILCVTQSGYSSVVPIKLLSNELNITSSTSSSVVVADGTIKIELTGSATYSSQIELMEVMTWRRVLTSQEVSDVHSYLSDKWNLNY